MKKIETLLFMVLMLFTVAGCKKEEKGTFTITGRVVQNCNDPIPVPEVELELQYSGSDLKGAAEFTIGKATTDSEGNFSITYDNIRQDPQNGLRLVENVGFGQRTVLSGIPKNSDVTLNDINLYARFPIKVKIKTDSLLTSSKDTIYYYTDKELFVVGPFINLAVIDTIDFWPIQNFKPGEYTVLSLYWRIRKNDTPIKCFTNYTICSNEEEAIIDLSQAK